MKRKWLKKGLALVLSAAMILGVLPQAGLSAVKVYAAANEPVTDEQFLDLSGLTDKAEAFSAYNLVDKGNAAKIRFGKNFDKAREWLIAGKDGENTLALLSTTVFYQYDAEARKR